MTGPKPLGSTTRKLSKPALTGLVPLIGAILLFVSGCAQTGSIRDMTEVPPTSSAMAGEPGKASVVFMRPRETRGKGAALIFEIKDQKPEVVGTIPFGCEVAWPVNPGEHLFMQTRTGEGAVFLTAHVLPDKTYYTLVGQNGPKNGGFSFAPIHRAQLDSPEFKRWLAQCTRLEKNSETDDWAARNVKSIRSKLANGLAAWNARPVSQRPTLLTEDGR
jgi:hypothetical protein